MSKLHIEEIHIAYDGRDLSQYGLFSLFAWYLMDVIKLPEHFAQVTVNRKKNESAKPHFFQMLKCVSGW